MFRLKTRFSPTGDQPKAIDKLTKGVLKGLKHQVLLGVTGSGKTFTIANVIARVGRPTLIIAHNKTLAAQLYEELKELFPENAVHYFVSYYDYYQPEAYIPETDTYIEKDAAINDYIDRLRHAATSSLFERRDVIIVSSVSCIYGIGSPEDYYGMLTVVEEGMRLNRDKLLRRLAEVQYVRSDSDLYRGCFRVKGDLVEVFPSHEESVAFRIEFFDDWVESIKEVDPISGKSIRKVSKVTIYPGTHYVAPREKLLRAIKSIEKELKERIKYFESRGMITERKRIEERTKHDLELLSTMGFCPGIENYSRHLSGRKPGEPPWTLIDYFPRDSLFIIDESHQTIPQLRGMYEGDRSRKLTLVEHGFRLPSALDNRPLNFSEFEKKITQVIYVSATPGPYELEKSRGAVVEQIIRPTGLTDPEVEVRPAENQVDDLLQEIRKRIAMGDRVLVTTLTKRMAEDLTEYYRDLGIRVKYLHSDIDTLERVRIVRDLRLGKFDVLIGINLLREGLDIPEVSLVAVLDADKEGFLRSETSLIQIFGRAARNVRGKVILYADRITSSMSRAIEETNRRRRIQEEYNRKNGITPRSIEKGISDTLLSVQNSDYLTVEVGEDELIGVSVERIPELINNLTREMKEAAKKLEFERAAQLRDRIKVLREYELKYAGEFK
ncbi:MAG: UvrABC system protein B [Deltaproteobacteria bacterium]|nr:MAG: UvrABC system protein B [Deltaproteobacteria bacterium]